MLPWDATERYFGRLRKQVAMGLHVSLSLVDAWCRTPKPIGDGEYSPVHRTIEIVRILNGAKPGAGDGLFGYVCTELGYLPPVKAIDVARTGSPAAMADLVRQFGALLAAQASTLDDGGLVLADAQRIRDEIEIVLGSLAQQRAQLDEFIRAEEEFRARRESAPNAMPLFFRTRS